MSGVMSNVCAVDLITFSIVSFQPLAVVA